MTHNKQQSLEHEEIKGKKQSMRQEQPNNKTRRTGRRPEETQDVSWTRTLKRDCGRENQKKNSKDDLNNNRYQANWDSLWGHQEWASWKDVNQQQKQGLFLKAKLDNNDIWEGHFEIKKQWRMSKAFAVCGKEQENTRESPKYSEIAGFSLVLGALTEKEVGKTHTHTQTHTHTHTHTPTHARTHARAHTKGRVRWELVLRAPTHPKPAQIETNKQETAKGRTG